MTLGDTWSFLRRAMDGDEPARNVVLERARGRLVLWAVARLPAELRGHLEPEDLAQEVLLAAFQAFPRFTAADPRQFWGWLFRIAENQVCDMVRYYGAQKRQPTERGHLTQTSPSAVAVRRESHAGLLAALGRLPDDYRQVIQLRLIEEQDVEGVAELMRRSPNAVRILYCRALKALREAVGGASRETASG